MASQSTTVAALAVQHFQSVSTKTFNYGYYPLRKGDIAPIFQLQQQAFVSIQHFLENQQPLTIAFYNNLDNDYSGLQKLENLQALVQQNGGTLIIITNNTSRGIKKAISQYNNLNVFFDTDNSIAELFGLYNETNPLSNWLSGLEDANASLPALYVIAPDRSIAYHHIDYEFELFKNGLSTDKNVYQNLLQAVNTVYEQFTYLSVITNKLVS